MHFTRSPRPVGQNFAETALENAPMTNVSMPPTNALRTHGKQLTPPPPIREASNLLSRGLLARLHGVDAGNKSAKRVIQSLPTLLRPQTTAVRPPLTEDGQPPSLHSRERSYLGPRAVSEPKKLTPLPCIEQLNAEMKVRHKREEEVMTRVEEALEETRRAKEKHREDVLAGVPRHYAFKPPKCLVIYEDDLQRFRRKRRKANREARLAEKRRAASDGKATGRRLSPSRATFPKVTDFISREQTKVDMNNATLEWTLPTRNYLHTQPADHRPTACGVPGGKLCRSFYPVTEALHREGTSVSKLKGRSLGPGDCLVAKVWPRNLQKFATPLEMATEDRRFFYRGQLAVPQHFTRQHLNALMLEHESTLYERQQMEEQMQLQQIEQRQLEQQLIHREQSLQEQQEEREQYEQTEQEQSEEQEQYEQLEQEQQEQDVLQGERAITEQLLHERQDQPVLQEQLFQEQEQKVEPVVETQQSNQQEDEKRQHLNQEILEAAEKEGDEDNDEEDDEQEDDD